MPIAMPNPPHAAEISSPHDVDSDDVDAGGDGIVPEGSKYSDWGNGEDNSPLASSSEEAGHEMVFIPL